MTPLLSAILGKNETENLVKLIRQCTSSELDRRIQFSINLVFVICANVRSISKSKLTWKKANSVQHIHIINLFASVHLKKRDGKPN